MSDSGRNWQREGTGKGEEVFSVMTASSSFNSLSCVEVQRVVQWSTGGSWSA